MGSKIDTKDPKFVQLCSDLHACWQSIGEESMTLAEEVGEDLDNKGALEGAMDADRLTYYPGGARGRASNDYLKGLIDGHGYDKVMAILNKEVRLV